MIANQIDPSLGATGTGIQESRVIRMLFFLEGQAVTSITNMHCQPIMVASQADTYCTLVWFLAE